MNFMFTSVDWRGDSFRIQLALLHHFVSTSSLSTCLTTIYRKIICSLCSSRTLLGCWHLSQTVDQDSRTALGPGLTFCPSIRQGICRGKEDCLLFFPLFTTVTVGVVRGAHFGCLFCDREQKPVMTPVSLQASRRFILINVYDCLRL